MDLTARRTELAEELQRCATQAKALTERCFVLQGAIAMLDEQLAPAAEATPDHARFWLEVARCNRAARRRAKRAA